jgi:hypothetical protein
MVNDRVGRLERTPIPQARDWSREIGDLRAIVQEVSVRIDQRGGGSQELRAEFKYEMDKLSREFRYEMGLLRGEVTRLAHIQAGTGTPTSRPSTPMQVTGPPEAGTQGLIGSLVQGVQSTLERLTLSPPMPSVLPSPLPIPVSCPPPRHLPIHPRARIFQGAVGS